MFDLDQAIKTLVIRGVEIGVARENSGPEELEDYFSIRLSADFMRLYRKIDGFRTCDFASQYTLWSMREIVRNNIVPIIPENDGTRWLSIGDFLMDSDLIAMALDRDDAKIKLLNENCVIAEGINEFMTALGAGKFDFLSE